MPGRTCLCIGQSLSCKGGVPAQRGDTPLTPQLVDEGEKVCSKTREQRVKKHVPNFLTHFNNLQDTKFEPRKTQHSGGSAPSMDVETNGAVVATDAAVVVGLRVVRARVVVWGPVVLGAAVVEKRVVVGRRVVAGDTVVAA
jgi:hypothetical protein